MGLKIYEYAGGTYQFIEGKQPEGAVLVEVKERPAPSNKARTAPQNKGGKGAGSTTKRNGTTSPTPDRS